MFFFDGASYVQKAGQVLMAKFPRTFCFHGGEHVVSLFFSSIAKIAPIKVLILKTCRFYNVFGSGANHAIHAQFMVGGLMVTIATAKFLVPDSIFLQKLVPGSNPQKVDVFFLANLA